MTVVKYNYWIKHSWHAKDDIHILWRREKTQDAPNALPSSWTSTERSLFRNAHLVIAAQTRGRKFNKESSMVGSTWLLKPFSFFSSSTQTKLFYLTLLSFCVRDFCLTEQCSQPLMFGLMFVVLLRGHLPLFVSHFSMML